MSPSRMSAPALLDHLRRDHRPVVQLAGEVDHDALVDQIVERQRGHVAFAAVGRMHGAVEMRADMQRRLDALRDDHLRLQVLRVVHLVAGIADPARRMHVHDVRKVDDLHHASLVHRLSRTRSISGFSWPPSISIMVPLTMCIKRRGQHDDEVRDLLDLGDAPHRDRGGRELVGLLVGELHVARHRLDQAGPALGAHRPGVDRARS